MSVPRPGGRYLPRSLPGQVPELRVQSSEVIVFGLEKLWGQGLVARGGGGVAARRR